MKLCAKKLVRCLSTAALLVPLVGACSSDDDSSGPSGGGGGSGGSSGSAATLTQVVAVLSASSCSACHMGAASSINGGLSFNPSDKTSVYNALVGKTSQGSNGSMCGGMTYVTAGKPSSSLFYKKLSASPGCGVRMPQGGTPLSDSDVALVSSWITGGAKND